MEGKSDSSKATQTLQLSSTGRSLEGEGAGGFRGIIREVKGGGPEVWDCMRCRTEALCLEDIGEQ